MSGQVVTQLKFEHLKKFFDIDVYPDGFWITSKKGVPIRANIEFHNLVDWDNERLHKQMAEEVLAKLTELLRLDKGYKEAPSEVYGHPAGQTNDWYIEVTGHYDTPTWGGLTFFKCPTKVLPYVQVKYRPGSPETPAVCKLTLNKEELQRLSRKEITLIDDKGRKLKVMLPYYYDEENDIVLMPAKVHIDLDIVCYKGKCGEIKYSGASVIDRRNKVFSVVHDANIFKPIVVQY